jgi:hypothetical protein
MKSRIIEKAIASEKKRIEEFDDLTKLEQD